MKKSRDRPLASLTIVAAARRRAGPHSSEHETPPRTRGRGRQFDAATTFVNEARNSRLNRRIAEVEGWHEGDSALQVALDSTASSFGRERIPVAEAAAVLRSLAGEKVHLLAVVARAKLEDLRLRGYADQVTEMYAAAALLLASAAPSLTAARPLRAV